MIDSLGPYQRLFRLLRRAAASCAVLAICLAAAAVAQAQAVPTKVVRDGNGWELLRDGKPYFIRGAGGNASPELLVKYGGNSIRTWGVGRDTQPLLDKAQQVGATVTVGIWIGGVNWNSPASVQKLVDQFRATVTKYKDQPAVLAWGIGNEMEGGNPSRALWQGINQIAAMCHQVDPNHPTMTVIAEIGGGGNKVKGIAAYCPDIDMIGVNSYGGGPSLLARYRQTGIDKPYVITEFGPLGQWETAKTRFGAPIEATSTAKCDEYQKTYLQSVLGAKGVCLGSYAFLWGSKAEATPTWYGMFLPGSGLIKTPAVDMMSQLWTGKPVPNPCPALTKIDLTGPDQVPAGTVVKASVEASDPTNGKLDIQWLLIGEMKSYAIATGPGATGPSGSANGIVKNGEQNVEIKMPDKPGVYRLYCTVRNANGAALGNVPIKVQ